MKNLFILEPRNLMLTVFEEFEVERIIMFQSKERKVRGISYGISIDISPTINKNGRCFCHKRYRNLSFRGVG